MKLEIPKGTRDFGPKEALLRDYVTDKLKEVFRSFGFAPLETPTIEKWDVMTAKFGAGETSDLSKEMFKLSDQGGRALGLRFELTFPAARFVAMNPQTRLPFKRFQIGSVFRDGPIKFGRYREFRQCDVDTFGIKDVIADAEIVAITAEVFKNLDLDVVVQVNSRTLLNNFLDYAGIKKGKIETTLTAIDKFDKIGMEGVEKEFAERGLSSSQINKLKSVLEVSGSNKECMDKIAKVIGDDKSGVVELRELFSLLDEMKVEYCFVPTLARGQAYYTGPIFETVLRDKSEFSSSLAGGGRYDKLIGKYLGDESKNIPATGISFGFAPIVDLLKKKKGEKLGGFADVFLAPIKTTQECLAIAQDLRAQGINVLVDISGKSISKNLDYADKMGIPFVGIVGKTELEKKSIKLKNMVSGDEELVPVSKVSKKLKE